MEGVDEGVVEGREVMRESWRRRGVDEGTLSHSVSGWWSLL